MYICIRLQDCWDGKGSGQKGGLGGCYGRGILNSIMRTVAEGQTASIVNVIMTTDMELDQKVLVAVALADDDDVAVLSARV